MRPKRKPTIKLLVDGMLTTATVIAATPRQLRDKIPAGYRVRIGRRVVWIDETEVRT